MDDALQMVTYTQCTAGFAAGHISNRYASYAFITREHSTSHVWPTLCPNVTLGYGSTPTTMSIVCLFANVLYATNVERGI